MKPLCSLDRRRAGRLVGQDQVAHVLGVELLGELGRPARGRRTSPSGGAARRSGAGSGAGSRRRRAQLAAAGGAERVLRAGRSAARRAGGRAQGRAAAGAEGRVTLVHTSARPAPHDVQSAPDGGPVHGPLAGCGSGTDEHRRAERDVAHQQLERARLGPDATGGRTGEALRRRGPVDRQPVAAGPARRRALLAARQREDAAAVRVAVARAAQLVGDREAARRRRRLAGRRSRRARCAASRPSLKVIVRRDRSMLHRHARARPLERARPLLSTQPSLPLRPRRRRRRRPSGRGARRRPASAAIRTRCAGRRGRRPCRPAGRAAWPRGRGVRAGS